MKKLCFVIFVGIVIASCSSISKLSETGDKEKQRVTDFLNLMVSSSDEKDEDKLMEFISPAYIKANEINVSAYEVNIYYPVGYNIESYNSADGMVVTKVWGENKSWIHKLVFKVVKEKRKLYLYPLGHSTDYIQPWFSAETFIKE